MSLRDVYEETLEDARYFELSVAHLITARSFPKKSDQCLTPIILWSALSLENAKL